MTISVDLTSTGLFAPNFVGDGVTDNSAACAAFNTWALTAGDDIDATFGAGGTFDMGFSDLIVGVPTHVLIDGNNNTTLKNPMGRMGSALVQSATNDYTHTARFQTTASGVSQITLVTAADDSKFTAGKWAILMGYDLQESGWPPNNAFFEYVQIASSTGGVVAFNSALQNGYKSTWPMNNSLGDVNQAGPATIMQCGDNWNVDYEVKNIIVGTGAEAAQLAVNCRKGVWTNCTFNYLADSNGLNISCSKELTFTNCTQNVQIECDKCVDTVTVTGGAMSFVFQSSTCGNLFTITGGTHTISGTPKKLVLDNVTATISVGVGYGRTTEIIATNCAITFGQTVSSLLEDIASVSTITGGVITLPKSLGPTRSNSRWAVPGVYVMFARKSGFFTTSGVPFTVVDVTDSGGGASGNFFIETNLGITGWPTLPAGSTGLVTWDNYCPKMMFTNCTSDPIAVDLSQAGAQGRPFLSYTKRLFDSVAELPTSPGTIAPITGQLVSIKVNVLTAHQGSDAPVTMHFMRGNVINSSGSEVAFDPVINLSVAGERIITPTTVTGAQSGDTISAPGSIWIETDQHIEAPSFGSAPSVSANLGGAGTTVVPAVTIEIITDQGVPETPTSTSSQFIVFTTMM